MSRTSALSSVSTRPGIVPSSRWELLVTPSLPRAFAAMLFLKSTPGTRATTIPRRGCSRPRRGSASSLAFPVGSRDEGSGLASILRTASGSLQEIHSKLGFRGMRAVGGSLGLTDRMRSQSRRFQTTPATHIAHEPRIVSVLQVACDGNAFRGRPGRVVRHHPGMFSSCRPASRPWSTRLGSSVPTRVRPKCAVTRHAMSAACVAVVNCNPIISADSGTTRSHGPGLVATRSLRTARARPSFTNRTCLRRLPGPSCSAGR